MSIEASISEQKFEWIKEPLEPDEKTIIFLPPIYIDKTRFGIYIGHWVIVLLYLILWILTMILWQKRKNKLKNKHLFQTEK